MRWTIATILFSTALVWAQLSPEEAQKRMDEMNAQAATQPVRPPAMTQPSVQRPQAARARAKRLKADAPQNIRAYWEFVMNRLPQERSIARAERDELASLVAKINRGAATDSPYAVSTAKQRLAKAEGRLAEVQSPDFVPSFPLNLYWHISSSPAWQLKVGAIGTIAYLRIIRIIDGQTLLVEECGSGCGTL